MAKEQQEEDKTSQDNYERPIPAWLPGQLNKTIREISSTDSSITGTISSLSILVKELYQRPETEISIEIVNEISEIKNKLSELETQKASQSASIKSLETFFDKNLQFMVIATEADGRMNNLEKQFSTIEKRINLIEDKANKTKDRSIAIWAITISVIGIIASILIAIFF